MEYEDAYAWLEELDRRMERDEEYCLWQKGAQNIMDYLVEHLPEYESDLLIDLMAAWKAIAIYETLCAYDLGKEEGQAKGEK